MSLLSFIWLMLLYVALKMAGAGNVVATIVLLALVIVHLLLAFRKDLGMDRKFGGLDPGLNLTRARASL